MKANASIYAKVQGSVTEVRVLIRDADLENWTADPTPQGRNARAASVSHKDKEVFRTQLGMWTPADPSFSFHLAGGKAGDSLRLTWWDAKGASHSIDSVIR